MYPSDYLYSEEHEWICRLDEDDDDVWTLGITDFAQNELGEVVYIDFPEVGESFDAGDSIGSIESVKAVSEIFTPVAGEIVEVNSDLDDAPENVNDHPHGDAWLVKLKVSEEVGELMSAEKYQDFLKTLED